MGSKTILMINKFFWISGGAESHMFALSSELAKRGNRVVPFSMKDERNLYSEFEKYFVMNVSYEMNQSRAKKIKSGLQSIYSQEAKSKIRKLILDVKPDIAHIHNFNYQLTPSILFELKRHNIPVVQTLHDPNIICPNHRLYDYKKQAICEDCRFGSYYKAITHKCIKNAILPSTLGALESYIYHFFRIYEKYVDLYISPSKFLRDKINSMGLRKIKIEVIPNFTEPIASNSLDNIGEYILFVGRLSSEKGVLLLLEAAKRLPNIPFRIIGTGPQEQELYEYCITHELSNVRFVGYCTKEEIRKEMSNAVAVVVPSQWYENCPMVILEAYGVGKPVIGSNLGGIMDLLEDGITGYLFEANSVVNLSDKIKNIWTLRDDAKDMGKKAFEKAQSTFGKDQYIEKIEELYQMLSRKHESGGANNGIQQG